MPAIARRFGNQRRATAARLDRPDWVHRDHHHASVRYVPENLEKLAPAGIMDTQVQPRLGRHPVAQLHRGARADPQDRGWTADEVAAYRALVTAGLLGVDVKTPRRWDRTGRRAVLVPVPPHREARNDALTCPPGWESVDQSMAPGTSPAAVAHRR